MNNPVVSIIMASYNHANYIQEAIESVIQQDFESWELIIVDDASTDQTAEVLDQYKNNPQIQVFYSEVNRQIHSRNFAASKAKGKYLAFLNSDDLFLPGKLKSQVDYLDNNPECGAVFSHVKMINENSKPLLYHGLEKLFASPSRSRHEWLNYFFEVGNCLCISSAMIDAELFNRIGKFNPIMVQLADVDLWTKVCFKKELHVQSKVLTCMRITDSNLSHPKPATLSRDFIESQHRVAHYFSEENQDDLALVFPEFIGFGTTSSPIWHRYLLARKGLLKKSVALRTASTKELYNLLQDDEVMAFLTKVHPRVMRSFLAAEGGAGLNFGYQTEWSVYDQQKVLEQGWFGNPVESVNAMQFVSPQCETALKLKKSGKHFTNCYRIRLFDQSTGTLLLDHLVSVKLFSKEKLILPAVDFKKFSGLIDVEISGQKSKSKGIKTVISRKLSRLLKSWLKRLPL